MSGYIAVQAAVGALPDVNHNVPGVAEDEVSDVPLGSVSTTRLTSSAGRMIGSMTKLLSYTEMADSSANEDVADFSLQVRELITLVSTLSGEEVFEVVDPVVASPVEDMEMTVLESSIEFPATRPRRPLGSLSEFDLAQRASDSGVVLPPFSTPLVDTVDGLPVSEADEDADDEGEPDIEWCDVYANDLASISGFHRLDISDDKDLDLRMFHLDEELDDSLHEDGLLIRGDLDVLPGWFTDR